MARKPHPTDFRDARWLAEAVHFNAMIFLGAGRYDRTDEIPTLEAAKAEAARLVAKHPGKRALIYGVTREGRSVMWTPELENLKMDTSIIGKTYSAKSAAVRALKASGLMPDQAEVQPDGARFIIAKPASKAAMAAASAKPAKRTDDAPRRPQLPIRAKAPEPKPAAKAASVGPTRIAKGADVKQLRRAPAPSIKPRRASDENQPKTRTHYDRSGAKAAREAGAPKRTNHAFAEAMAAAERGVMPKAPDFSSDTHRPYRARLAEQIAMLKAGDLKGLQAIIFHRESSSLNALKRFRDLSVAYLKAKKR